MRFSLLHDNGAVYLSRGLFTEQCLKFSIFKEAGLLDPYELVKSVTVPAGPGHVTE